MATISFQLIPPTQVPSNERCSFCLESTQDDPLKTWQAHQTIAPQSERLIHFIHTTCLSTLTTQFHNCPICRLSIKRVIYLPSEWIYKTLQAVNAGLDGMLMTSLVSMLVVVGCYIPLIMSFFRKFENYTSSNQIESSLVWLSIGATVGWFMNKLSVSPRDNQYLLSFIFAIVGVFFRLHPEYFPNAVRATALGSFGAFFDFICEFIFPQESAFRIRMIGSFIGFSFAMYEAGWRDSPRFAATALGGFAGMLTVAMCGKAFFRKLNQQLLLRFRNEAN